MQWKYLPLAAVALLFGPVASLSGCRGGSQSRVSAEATSYNISGTITPVANGAGAKVTLSEAASATTTADTSGNYGFTGLANGSYTLTPTKTAFTFTPASHNITVNGANQTVNFTAVAQAWTVSGTITPVANGAGVTVTLSGVASATTTADTSGNYSFTGLANGMYSVTPSKSGYTFSPAAQSATINDANLANVNFAVSVGSPVAVSVSPTSPVLLTGDTQQFTATVTGTTNTAVTWSATGGTVSSSGLYTASGTVGTYTVTATSVADTTKSASATVSVTTAAPSTALLGDQNVESQVSSIPLGQAEAFQATADANGTVQSLVVYLDSTATVSQLAAGVYADAGGHPGALLSQGISTQLRPGVWNSIAVPSANLTAGTAYWIAFLGTGSGIPAVRSGNGSCASESSGQTQLTTLPSTWVTGTTTSTCPLSVFSDTGKVFFFDNFPGTQLSADWTVISRHGEYSQNETECNIPQQITVANGLTVTTAVQTWTCGDFYPDGTVWHTPSPWPYITGDIQWTSLNFTYGTVEIRAKFPDQSTSLWPATWLLGSNCQSTNPFTGETGVGTCPNLGSSGYTEIDMTECYGSGWCQFHVANPSFGIGNGCDATYTVDTNYHRFKMVWDSSGITQYMDGVATTACALKLNNPMFLIIQTQTGGVGGTPNNALLPATVVVDYVKVTLP